MHEKIRQLLQYSELDTAFELVLTVTDDIDIQNKFILLRSQWVDIQTLYLQGQLTFDEYFKEKNRITFAFLTFLENIDVPSESKTPTLKLPIESDTRYFDIVKQAFTDYENNNPPRLPTDSEEQAYYLNAFLVMLYRTVKHSKK